MANWWKKLKYWQKGVLIGFALQVTPYALFFISSYTNSEIISILLHDLLEPSRQISFIIVNDCFLCTKFILSVIFFNFIQWVLLGALIGFIIGKVKGK